MSKFKVGDKVKRVSNIEIFKSHGGTEGIYEVKSIRNYEVKFNGVSNWWVVHHFELAQDEWTVYNNDKPLNELTDDQRGLLVNHLFNGGNTQLFNGEVWLDMLSGFTLINREYIYRAKQKSERELFIEKGLAVYESEEVGGNVESLLGAMFDSDFKAPKGGE